MSTIRNPVGPQPPAVYWRRRLLLALGVIAVIVVIVLIVKGQPGKPAADKTPKPGPSASDTPSGNPFPSSSSTPGTGDTGNTGSAPACAPASVNLIAITNASSYSAGSNPQLSMTVMNTGAAACSYDVGTGAQEYIITSGNDSIWDSKDCQTAPTSTQQVLQPGVALTTSPPLAWDRTRSSKTTCNSTRPPVIAGGASYHLSVKLGASSSAATVQFVLK